MKIYPISIYREEMKGKKEKHYIPEELYFSVLMEVFLAVSTNYNCFQSYIY